VETEASRIDGYRRLFLIVRHRTLRVAQTPCDKVPSMRRTICADPQRYVDQY
jgi:septum formation topological specificity factor MinE